MFEPKLVVKYHKDKDNFTVKVSGNFTKGMVYAFVKAILDDNPDVCQILMTDIAKDIIKKKGMLN